MFFMLGIDERQEELDHDQLSICDSCGSYGRYMVFMTYSVLLLFFIPTFRFNYRYYVKTSCCNTIYELDPAIGAAIAKGEKSEIRPEDLRLIQAGSSYKKCPVCGYETAEDFAYCPKCGQHL